MRKRIVLTPGVQKDFVNCSARALAYIGGLGSGKTFSGIVKGLKASTQKLPAGSMFGPRGLIGASSYGVLRKVVLPQFFEIIEGTDLWKTGNKATSWVKSEMKARLVANCGCKDVHACDHEVEIYLASLDDPDELRGMELSWFFIDEGRNTTSYAWEVLWGRLRQQGFKHAGWVCSTPNGFDWMYEQFHPDSASPRYIQGSKWFNAATYDNPHLPPEYIESLEAQYHGRFFEQEVLGRFVGMTEGAVFFEWDPKDGAVDVPFDPKLPLFSEWDFGVGDLNVVLFFQLDYEERKPSPGSQRTLLFPVKRYVGYMEGKDITSKEWARRFKEYCQENFGGRMPKQNIGDPAGRQRNLVTGTSVIADLASHGVIITPAPKRPIDYAVRILNNMMADHRVLVDRTKCGRLSQAFASHRWQKNAYGVKRSNVPVHDWTSHPCDAARYGTAALISPFVQEKETSTEVEYGEGTFGYLMKQLDAAEDEERFWLGPKDVEEITWQPVLRPRART